MSKREAYVRCTRSWLTSEIRTIPIGLPCRLHYGRTWPELNFGLRNLYPMLLHVTQSISNSRGCPIGHSTKPFQINIDIKTKKTLRKVTLNLKQPVIKNCINFIRRQDICRVWDVSLSHYPFQRLIVFCHLMRLYFVKRTTTMSPQSPIELICGLTHRQESFRNTTNLNFKKISA